MIILVRHATPNVDYGFCHYQRARELMKEYDVVTDIALDEVREFKHTNNYGQIKGVIPGKIFCSPLIRAQLTCGALFKNVPYQTDNLFKEAENEISALPLIRLKLRHWFMLNRIKWLAGIHSRDIEDLNAFKARVDAAFEKVMGEHPENNTVVVVAHGVFLHQFRKLLRERAPRWIDGFTFKKGCFTITVYKHVSEFK